MELHSLHSSDGDINYISSSCAATIEDLIKQMEALEATLKSKPLPSTSHPPLEPIVGVITSECPVGLLAAAAQMLDEQQKQNDKKSDWTQIEREKLARISTDEDAIQADRLLLTKVAAKYAAPPIENNDQITIQFHPAWGPTGPNDLLQLTNNGRDLSDCTVLVELANANGETYQNVHFIKNWPKNTTLLTAYSQGTQIVDQILNRFTVTNPKTISVKILSPQFSTRLLCNFTANDRDNSIARRCEKLRIIGACESKQALLGSRVNFVSLTLDGLAFIPKGQIELLIQRGTLSRQIRISFPQWIQGEPKHIRLPFMPDAARVVISFPDTDYQYTTNIR